MDLWKQWGLFVAAIDNAVTSDFMESKHAQTLMSHKSTEEHVCIHTGSTHGPDPTVKDEVELIEWKLHHQTHWCAQNDATVWLWNLDPNAIRVHDCTADFMTPSRHHHRLLSISPPPHTHTHPDSLSNLWISFNDCYLTLSCHVMVTQESMAKTEKQSDPESSALRGKEGWVKKLGSKCSNRSEWPKTELKEFTLDIHHITTNEYLNSSVSAGGKQMKQFINKFVVTCRCCGHSLFLLPWSGQKIINYCSFTASIFDRYIFQYNKEIHTESSSPKARAS